MPILTEFCKIFHKKICSAFQRIINNSIPNIMKNKFLLFFSMVMLACTLAQAQTEKGKWLVGATTSNFSLSGDRDYSQFSLQLSPSVGYFVTDNLAVGVRLGFSASSTRALGVSVSRTSSLGAGIFGRYYIPLTERIKIPIELETNYVRGFGRINSNPNNFGYMSSGIYSGVSIFLNDAISLDLMAGYRLNAFSDSFSNSTQGSLSGKIGFSLYLDCKGKE
jgi:hypothetical protein